MKAAFSHCLLHQISSLPSSLPPSPLSFFFVTFLGINYLWNILYCIFQVLVLLLPVRCICVITIIYGKLLGSVSDWCGSIGWVLSHKVKGHQLDSGSGHMPELQVQSRSGHIGEETNWCFSLTSTFLPPFPSLKINK